MIARHILPLLAISIATAQQRPRFEDYPVKEIFTGTPAAPILATPQERLYRARIREGVSKGLGVIRDGIEQPGPNFAGHYIIVSWYCGLPCELNAIVDAVTGRIYGPPFSEGLALPVITRGGPEHPQWEQAIVEFRLNSKLMILDANPGFPKDQIIYRHYFLWENNRWTLLRRTPLLN